MSKHSSVIYQHADHPEWGRGVILAAEGGRADRLDLAFEMGGRRTILKTFATKLTQVDLPADEAMLLGDKLASRRSSSAPVRGVSKKTKSPAVVASFASFEAQVAFFEAEFPGGFRGEKFEKDVRGVAGAKRKKTDTGPALAEAAQVLSEAALSSSDSDAAFEAVTALVRTTAFVHPLEGANLLGTMAPAQRPAFLAALRELLHGKHGAADRFEHFVAAIRLEEKGAPKRPSWPLATMFAALAHPTKHVCVKPTVFQKQAALLRVGLDYQPVPSAAVYEQLLTTARKTEEALRAAGHDPRDLVDVASFIGLTQGAKPAAKV